MKKHFKYVDNKTGKVLADIQASDILEADEILKQQTGIVITKCPWIGCQIYE